MSRKAVKEIGVIKFVALSNHLSSFELKNAFKIYLTSEREGHESFDEIFQRDLIKR